MKKILLLLVLSSSLQLPAQDLPQLLKDITPGSQNSDITDLAVVGDIVFFIAPNGSNSFQLWRTDGTTAGTYVVKVINPTSPSGMYSYFTSMVNVGGTLFFLADDGVHGVEYWKSDGTEVGTVLIKDIAPGSADAFTDFGIDADFQAVIGDILYVSASGGELLPKHCAPILKEWLKFGLIECLDQNKNRVLKIYTDDFNYEKFKNNTILYSVKYLK